MTLSEAIAARHSVRKYRHQPLTEDIINALQAEIDECNRLGKLHMQLVTDETKAFTGMLAYGKFHGVENYIVMAGPKDGIVDERIGYYGERLVLLAQQLGLNTCWVGLTYKKVSGAYSIAKGEKLACVIALGYGENQGASHKIKAEKDVIKGNADAPQWFHDGVRAALLAPTAINQQKFSFEYIVPRDGGLPQVAARKGFSFAGYTQIDLGIAKLHFEIGAGKNNFTWA